MAHYCQKGFKSFSFQRLAYGGKGFVLPRRNLRFRKVWMQNKNFPILIFGMKLTRKKRGREMHAKPSYENPRKRKHILLALLTAFAQKLIYGMFCKQNTYIALLKIVENF